MIVVGVDGSEGAESALEFAVAEAALREARLRIVSAWDVPTIAYGGDLGPPLDAATWDALESRAKKIADDALAAVKKLQPSVEGEAVAVQGHAGNVILEQSSDAELIVVGRRTGRKAGSACSIAFSPLTARPRRGTPRVARPGCSPIRAAGS